MTDAAVGSERSGKVHYGTQRPLLLLLRVTWESGPANRGDRSKKKGNKMLQLKVKWTVYERIEGQTPLFLPEDPTPLRPDTHTRPPLRRAGNKNKRLTPAEIFLAVTVKYIYLHSSCSSRGYHFQLFFFMVF